LSAILAGKEFTMSSEVPIPPPGFDGLSVNEQVEYVEQLLNYIASRPDYVTIPDWHREILSERMARYGSAVNEGTTLEEFEQELTKS
jgi:putative addiction module component (TIGR02574 family)